MTDVLGDLKSVADGLREVRDRELRALLASGVQIISSPYLPNGGTVVMVSTDDFERLKALAAPAPDPEKDER